MKNPLPECFDSSEILLRNQVPVYMERFGDLHIHSIHSDGLWSVDQIMKNARSLGISYLAIADHDSIDGSLYSIELGEKLGIRVFPAVEINTDKHELHILGYMFNCCDENFLAALKNQRDSRINRGKKMVENLIAAGIDISFKDVTDEAQTESIGRPHIARALLKKGIISSFEDAFRMYIGNDCPYYVHRDAAMTPEEAIDAIHGAGGCAVLAHPVLSQCEDSDLEYYVEKGIDGVEVFHSSQGDTRIQKKYLDFAKRHNLVITGGSDCHGGENSCMGRIRLEEKYICELIERFGG